MEFCLKNTYFVFQGRYYEELEGAAMGSPISPIVDTLYMENCLQKTWDTSVLQRRKNHQRPPAGTQRQRSYNQEEWCHLQIQM